MTKKEKKGKRHKKSAHLALAADGASIPSQVDAKAPPTLSTKSQARVDALVREVIERIADKWTMIVLELLAEHGTVRFTALGKLAGGVSQKMLTKTLRQMESDGLVKRTVHPVVPPHVDYSLTETGASLGEAFCGVWLWAEKHYGFVETSRAAFIQKHSPSETAS